MKQLVLVIFYIPFLVSAAEPEEKPFIKKYMQSKYQISSSQSELIKKLGTLIQERMRLENQLWQLEAYNRQLFDTALPTNPHTDMATRHAILYETNRNTADLVHLFHQVQQLRQEEQKIVKQLRALNEMAK